MWQRDGPSCSWSQLVEVNCGRVSRWRTLLQLGALSGNERLAERPRVWLYCPLSPCLTAPFLSPPFLKAPFLALPFLALPPFLSALLRSCHG